MIPSKRKNEPTYTTKSIFTNWFLCIVKKSRYAIDSSNIATKITGNVTTKTCCFSVREQISTHNDINTAKNHTIEYKNGTTHGWNFSCHHLQNLLFPILFFILCTLFNLLPYNSDIAYIYNKSACKITIFFLIMQIFIKENDIFLKNIYIFQSLLYRNMSFLI